MISALNLEVYDILLMAGVGYYMHMHRKISLVESVVISVVVLLIKNYLLDNQQIEQIGEKIEKLMGNGVVETLSNTMEGLMNNNHSGGSSCGNNNKHEHLDEQNHFNPEMTGGEELMNYEEENDPMYFDDEPMYKDGIMGGDEHVPMNPNSVNGAMNTNSVNSAMNPNSVNVVNGVNGVNGANGVNSANGVNVANGAMNPNSGVNGANSANSGNSGNGANSANAGNGTNAGNSANGANSGNGANGTSNQIANLMSQMENIGKPEGLEALDELTGGYAEIEQSNNSVPLCEMIPETNIMQCYKQMGENANCNEGVVCGTPVKYEDCSMKGGYASY